MQVTATKNRRPLAKRSVVHVVLEGAQRYRTVRQGLIRLDESHLPSLQRVLEALIGLFITREYDKPGRPLVQSVADLQPLQPQRHAHTACELF